MKDRISAGLLLVMLAGLPTLAHALDIGGTFTEGFNIIAAFFKLALGSYWQ